MCALLSICWPIILVDHNYTKAQRSKAAAWKKSKPRNPKIQGGHQNKEHNTNVRSLITRDWRTGSGTWWLAGMRTSGELGGGGTKMRNADQTGTLERVEKETEVQFQGKQQQKNEQGTKTNGKKRKKRREGQAQLVKCLQSKHKDLSSNPMTHTICCWAAVIKARDA